jgi:DNA-binding NtrC family response regulator
MTRIQKGYPEVILLMPRAQAGEVAEALKGAGYGLVCFQTLPEFHRHLKGKSFPSAAILDIDSMALTNGEIKEVYDLSPTLPLFCMSSKPTHPHLRQALKEIVFACLRTPVQHEELRFLLDSVLLQGKGK